MSKAVQSFTTNRRSLLGALSFFPFVAAVPALAAAPADPVLAALEIYAQARADYNLASDEYGRIEEEHREIRFYHPRVRIGTQTVFGYGQFEDRTNEIFVESEAEIARFYEGDKAEKLIEALNADRARHAADLERIGFTAADKALDLAGDRLQDAEALVLTAVPTTEDGAVALANFAAKIAEDDNPDELVTAIRTLGDWLIKRRRARLEA